jgi:hypothetical protein
MLSKKLNITIRATLIRESVVEDVRSALDVFWSSVIGGNLSDHLHISNSVLTLVFSGETRESVDDDPLPKFYAILKNYLHQCTLSGVASFEDCDQLFGDSADRMFPKFIFFGVDVDQITVERKNVFMRMMQSLDYIPKLA